MQLVISLILYAACIGFGRRIQSVGPKSQNELFFEEDPASATLHERNPSSWSSYRANSSLSSPDLRSGSRDLQELATFLFANNVGIRPVSRARAQSFQRPKGIRQSHPVAALKVRPLNDEPDIPVRNVQIIGGAEASEVLRAETKAEAVLANHVFESIKDDINNILRVEPHWDLFADNLQLIDPKGTKVGLSKIKELLRTVRKFRSSFISKDYVDIQTRVLEHGNTRYPNLIGSVMVVNGAIKLKGRGLPFPLPPIPFDLKVDGACRVYFNQDGKASIVEVGSWLFNGRPIDLPFLDSSSSGVSLKDGVELLKWTGKAIFGMPF